MDESKETDDQNHPSPLDFVEYLPWACNQLQLDAVVVINKIYQNEYVSAYTDRTKHKPKSKAKLTRSRADVSSEQDKDGKSLSPFSIMNTGKIVRISTIYDNNDNLVHIRFDKNRIISRPILKLIGMIVQFQTHLTAITINGGMDKYTLYELRKFLTVTQITDICLDNSFLSEANFSILLENQSMLKNLSLSRCKIDDNVIESISVKLKYPQPASKTLSILNLSCNRITDIGAKYLGEALKSNRQLSYLNLADNMLTDDGAAEILNGLIEFSLSWEELFAARIRHMNYLKEKNEMIIQIVKDLKAGDFDRRTAKRKSIRPTSTSSSAQKKSRVLEKEISIKNMETMTKSQGNLDSMFYEKAEFMAENVLGEFKDPFTKDNIIAKDGTVYCYGNTSLCYLNLSYNNLTYFTLRKLLNVVMYQKLFDRKPRGLIKVSIEGNNMPISCKDLTQLDDILEMGLIAQHRKQSLAKKRPQSKITSR